MKNKKGDLRIWHIPQVPMKAFRVEVKNIDEAKLLLRTLWDYDTFQFVNKVKPDYSNASGLEEFDGKEWTEYCNANGQDIDEIMDEEVS